MITSQQAIEWFNKTRELTKFKKHKPLIADIIHQTTFLPNNSSIPQRLWHVVNTTSEIPKCKMCPTNVSWDHRYKKYKTYCGNPVCVGSDPEIINNKKLHTNYNASVLKRQITNLERYGVTNYLATDQVIQRNKILSSAISKEQHKHRAEQRSKTLMSLYGVENYSHLQLSIGVLDKLKDPTWLYSQHYTHQKSLTQISDELQVAGGATTIGQYLKRHGLSTQTLPARSYGEKQISQFLTEYSVEHSINNRDIISPLELDIYIPTYKLAIEYCGLYWHSEQQGKGRQYHKRKYEMCKDKGIQLLTIFEDEWVERQAQVKQKITSLLNKSNTIKVFARNTTIVELSTSEKDTFFNANHIQGTGPGSITYGLKYNNQIVAAMCWIKQQTQWVLNRYATCCRVPGGFSKLLYHFQCCTQWSTLVSFADLRWSVGNLYEKTGWTLHSILPPDYFYSPDGHTRIHKFNYRRKNLPTKLKKFDPSLSETENCKANNILRIWDCGKHRYVLINPQHK